MRRLVLILCLFTIAVMSRSASATPPATVAGDRHPWDNKRVYYLIEQNGVIREKGFFVRRPGTYQKQPCVIIEDEKSSVQPLQRSMKSKTITTPGGAALYREEEILYGDFGREEITVADGVADIVANGYFGQSARISVPESVLFEISGEWLASRNLSPGKTLTVDLLDREARTVSRESVVIGARSDNADPSGPAAWTAEFRSESRPPLYARFTTDGRLLRLESEGMVYQVASRREYDEERRIAQTPLTPLEPMTGIQGVGAPAGIAIGAALPAWDSFAWLVLRCGPSGAWREVFQTSEYAEIVDVGFETNIVTIRNAPRVDVAATLPMSVPPEVQPYLAASIPLPAQNRAVFDAARNAVLDDQTRRPEENALKAISYLAGWINQAIAFAPNNPPAAAVPDILVNRTGCALDHARLFATMARGLGIPSRLCQGFLARPGEAVYHVWAEAWINGGWIPVDTTVSRVGLPAGYALAERSMPDGTLGPNVAAFMMNPLFTLELVSAGRETPARNHAELVIGDRRTYAIVEGDWMANLYWGFALRLPQAWNGTAKLNSVEIASPDRLANIKCEALGGDYLAGRAELDGNIAVLQSGLDRFRLIDGRLVSFDPDGAAPALFIDFACDQVGQSLRCRQYVIPRRQRAFRISFWAPTDIFDQYAPVFDSILASFEF
ncbi:MAG: transglutaminase-like domain-containing protein [Planctomycetota bacterium]|jgi:transglutaminase-like putative cysteine protease|nr:transglutaminase-like domain-containing protein [Planctomycetota bacterium]